MRRFRYFVSPGAIAVGLMLLVAAVTPSPASAHERRVIANGQAEVEVGWWNEPSYVDQPNTILFVVTDATTKEPIEGVEKTVKVEVTKGGAIRTFDLRARVGEAGEQGVYVADIVPTSTGDYIFRFTGDIKGVAIDERFESGPGRFAGIQAMTAFQFPAAQPTAGELKAQLDEARAAADSARTIAMIGMAVGVLGLLAAAAAFARRGQAGAAGRAATIPGD